MSPAPRRLFVLGKRKAARSPARRAPRALRELIAACFGPDRVLACPPWSAGYEPACWRRSPTPASVCRRQSAGGGYPSALPGREDSLGAEDSALTAGSTFSLPPEGLWQTRTPAGRLAVGCRSGRKN